MGFMRWCNVVVFLNTMPIFVFFNQLVIGNKQSKYTNTRTPRSNCIRVMQPTGIIKSVGLNN